MSWKGESRRHSLARKGIRTIEQDGRSTSISMGVGYEKMGRSEILNLIESNPLFDISGFSEKKKERLITELQTMVGDLQHTHTRTMLDSLLEYPILFKEDYGGGYVVIGVRSKHRISEPRVSKVVWDSLNVPTRDDFYNRRGD